MKALSHSGCFNVQTINQLCTEKNAQIHKKDQNNTNCKLFNMCSFQFIFICMFWSIRNSWLIENQQYNAISFVIVVYVTHRYYMKAHTAGTWSGASPHPSPPSGWTGTASPSWPSERLRTASWRSAVSSDVHVSYGRHPARPACWSWCCPDLKTWRVEFKGMWRETEMCWQMNGRQTKKAGMEEMDEKNETENKRADWKNEGKNDNNSQSGHQQCLQLLSNPSCIIK